MLARKGILPKPVARVLSKGLGEIENAWTHQKFYLDPSQEDVHSNVENWLIRKYGLEVGGRLHTARSRNDQVAVDVRLYLRDCVLNFLSELISLINILLNHAQKEGKTISPGYTHHQPAQITTLGHIWLSFAESLNRDRQRFQEWFQRFNENPLGSMTGYGTSFAIDRNLTSKLLGFDKPCPNSLDPIQNRWEPEAEMGFAIAAMMNHLSSLAQTLILGSTGEFGLFRLDDDYCTGSSMMPQKRNPDPLEIIKAKAADAHGLLASLLAIGRSLFLGYNRDTQWSKYLIMDLIDECLPVPRIMGEIIGSLSIHKGKMMALCQKGFISAPDILERLVQEWGLSFRQAKVAVEKAVKYSEAEGEEQISLSALGRSLQEEGLSLKIEQSFVPKAQDPQLIVSRRKAIGGTSPQALERNIAILTHSLQDAARWLAQKRNQELKAKTYLREMERNL
jgi:argininosuccinate lyase